jgi:hypothetical protein
MRYKSSNMNYKSANIIALFYLNIVNVLAISKLYQHRQRLLFFPAKLVTSKALSYPLLLGGSLLLL